MYWVTLGLTISSQVSAGIEACLTKKGWGSGVNGKLKVIPVLYNTAIWLNQDLVRRRPGIRGWDDFQILRLRAGFELPSQGQQSPLEDVSRAPRMENVNSTQWFTTVCHQLFCVRMPGGNTGHLTKMFTQHTSGWGDTALCYFELLESSCCDHEWVPCQIIFPL